MAETDPYIEYGLRTPDGQVFWSNFQGRPLGTEAERTVLVLVLRKTAQECCWLEDEFISRYLWVSRTVQLHNGELPIDTPSIAPPADATPQPAAEPPAPAAPASEPAESPVEFGWIPDGGL